MTVPFLVPASVRSLDPFVQAGVFGLTEVHLATTLAAADPTAPAEVLLGAALAVRAPLHGSVCVELATIRDTVVSSLQEPTELAVTDTADPSTSALGGELDDDLTYLPALDTASTDAPGLEELDWPSAERWGAQLAASSLVDIIDHGATASSAPRSPSAPLRPLVLEHGRLYLARYWHLERLVGADLLRRTTARPPSATDAHAADRIAELFANAAADTGTPVDAGQLAAAHAVAERDLVVISGGPGTGKTTTVARLLAGLVSSQHERPGPVLPPAGERIALVAPTGKAAARMTEAIREAVPLLASHLPDSVVNELAALEAVTIHRLLGTRGAGFWHGPDRPIPHDLVVVDEVSMVSLSLMAHLLAAIPRHARVVLVGDPYQLASVEAGTVLGDVVGLGADRLADGAPTPPSGVAPSVRPLTRVHRQKAGSAILDLATAIREGHGDRAMELLATADPEEVCWIDPSALDRSPTLTATDLAVPRRGPDDPQATLFEAGLGAPTVDAGYGRLHRARYAALRQTVHEVALAAVRAAAEQDLEGALDAIASVKVLCALRRGASGVDGWNRTVDEHLREARAIARGDWYAGRPTMVTENDYLNRVFNGDVGVAVPVAGPVHDGPQAARYRVVFRRPVTNQEVDAVRLDRVTTQWAMSIHKSQGSEFAHAVVVLPPPPARILTRELLYTGVTRAKDRLTVVASEASIRAAVARPVARASGLAARLGGSGSPTDRR